MKRPELLPLAITCAFVASTVSEVVESANPYIGLGTGLLALDNQRITGVPTRSIGHAMRTGCFQLGYRFNPDWFTDLVFGSGSRHGNEVDHMAINAHRAFGESRYRPYLSAGVSRFKVEDAVDEITRQAQVGFGLSTIVDDNIEVRIGYQHFIALGDESYNDDSVTFNLNWHFRAR